MEPRRHLAPAQAGRQRLAHRFPTLTQRQCRAGEPAGTDRASHRGDVRQGGPIRTRMVVGLPIRLSAHRPVPLPPNPVCRRCCTSGVTVRGVRREFRRAGRRQPCPSSRASSLDAELTEQGVIILPGHRTPDAARGYAKKTDVQRLAAVKERRAWVQDLGRLGTQRWAKLGAENQNEACESPLLLAPSNIAARMARSLRPSSDNCYVNLSRPLYCQRT